MLSGVAAGALDLASQAATRASGGAGGALEVAGTVYGRVSDAAAPAALTAAAVGAAVGGAAAVVAKDLAVDAAENAREKAVAAALATKEKAEQLIARAKFMLECWAKQKLYALVEDLVDRIPGITKDFLEDPQMPRCASRGKDRLVDSVWPDVREELLWETAVLLDKQSKEKLPEEDKEPPPCCFLKFFRYHLFPYDKGFWGQWRDPVYILLRLISMIPVYGVSPFFFLFEFIIIDKSDEFQLISFIVGFKGTQFISAGIIRAITGLVLFYVCLTAQADDSNHSCEEHGPGNSNGFWLVLLGFVIQVVIIWVAFLLLPWSVDKGRSRLKGGLSQDKLPVAGAGRRGAYIKHLLWYDLVSAVLCSVVPALVIVLRPKPGSFADEDIWYVEHVIFASQIVYGLLTVPFFLFTLPGLSRVLTHAMPTAYDREGRCVQPIGPVRRKEEEVQQALAMDEALVTDDDARSLLDKLKAGPAAFI